MMRDTRTLKSLFPDPKPPRRKNFIKENVESLRRMEQIMHNDGNAAKGLKLPILRKTRLSKISDDISNTNVTNGDGKCQHLKVKEVSEDESRKQNKKKSCFTVSNSKIVTKKLPKSSNKMHNHKNLKADSLDNVATEKVDKSSKDNHIKCKSQGVQTLDTDDIESLYSEGVIRYPSGRAKELIEESVNIKNYSEYNENETQVKLDKETKLSNKIASQLNAPPASYRIGVVPKYIKDRKEALQKEQLAKIAEKHADCPAGHVPLPDNERKETLSMLKKNYQEYVSELNMLPIRTDTLRSQKRKMEIEKQLTKLEEAIKVFTRPKVFVKVDS